MHNRLDSLENRKTQVLRDERRARGSSAGVITIGGVDSSRRMRSRSNVFYLSTYTVGSPVTQYSPLGFGQGKLGSTFGFMEGAGRNG